MLLHMLLGLLLLLLLSRFSRVWLCATPQIAAQQAPPSLGFSRQEHWSGLPFPSPMHESEKWKWSHSVVPNSSRPHELQPTRLLCPWDFPGKSTGVGCHYYLRLIPGGPAESPMLLSMCMLRHDWAIPWTVAHQTPLSMGYFSEEYWSGLPFPPPGDLPNPGIKPACPGSPALAGGFLTISIPNFLKDQIPSIKYLSA